MAPKVALIDTEWAISLIGMRMKVPDNWWNRCKGRNLHDGKISSYKESTGLSFAVPAKNVCIIINLFVKGKNPSPINLPIRFAEDREAENYLKVSSFYFKGNNIEIGSSLIAVNNIKIKTPSELDFLLRGKTGDIKLIWEQSRMDWVLAFAQRARNGDQKSLGRLNTWLVHWLEKNPPYFGANWKCGQEASIRVIHLCCAALILGQELMVLLPIYRASER